MPPLAAVVRVVVLAVGLALASAVVWAEGSSPRGAQHEGYGRMVFDWPEPVNYSAEVLNGQLVVRFDRPVAGDLRVLLKPLGKYLGGVSVSGDRRMATFPLSVPVQVKAFTTAGSVVIDLVDGPAPEAKAPAAAKTAEPRAPGDKPAPEPADVGVRGGDHGAYFRLVFDWPKPVEYRVDKQGDKVRLVFQRTAALGQATLKAALPADVDVDGIEVDDHATAVALKLPPGARLRHFTAGPKVVVDVVRSGDAATPGAKVAVSADEPPLPTLAPLGPQPAPPKTPAETLAAQAKPAALTAPAPAGKPPAAVTPAALPAPAATAAAKGKPAAVAAPAPPPPVVDDDARADDLPPPEASLGFSWTQPTAVAVFRRAGWLWIVFDRRQEADLDLLRRQGGTVVEFIEQLPSRDSTVIRLLAKPEYNANLRRDGLLWVVDLARQSPRPQVPVDIALQTGANGQQALFLAAPEPGVVLGVRDPEVGDQMVVVPVLSAGYGVFPQRDYPELSLLPTQQGVVVTANVDAVDVRTSRNGVDVGVPEGGVHITPDSPSQQQGLGAAPSSSVLDIDNWKRGGTAQFPKNKKLIQLMLAAAPPTQRNAARLEAARFYLANGFAAEALGIMRTMGDDDPTLIDTAAFRAVRGAGNFLMGRYDLSAADLAHPTLQSSPEAQFWLAAARAAIDEPGLQASVLEGGLRLIRGYPKTLKQALALQAVEVGLAVGNDHLAREALSMAGEHLTSSMERGRNQYYQGRLSQLTGDWEGAIEHFVRAEAGASRPHRAKAATARIELLLKTKKITLPEAIEGYEKLRFAWRGEDFEFAYLKRLGELKVQNNEFGEGLRTWKQLVALYPNNKATPAVWQRMGDTFVQLFMGGAADKLQPVVAIGLFDEFRDFTPLGPKGDEMIKRLATRLAAVDLLDRAGDLLEHQVTQRLQGLDKATAGTQLSVIRILDHQPAQAIAALNQSDVADMPHDLVLERRRLQARALSDLGRPLDAVALLVGDDSVEAKQLKAEIFWKAQNWAEVGATMESLAAKPVKGQPLDEASARLVLYWAAALALGNDDRGLTRLRRQYGESMEKTTYKDGFRLLASDTDQLPTEYTQVGARIKEADGFTAFMAAYRKKLQAEGLSVAK